MSGTVAERKRLLKVSSEDLAAGTLCLAGHSDFFPLRKKAGANVRVSRVEVEPEGLNSVFGALLQEQEPKKKLRLSDVWIDEFFARHKIQSGDILALERLTQRRYRLYPFESKPIRSDDWKDLSFGDRRSAKPSVIELFAGCGGMALGFKRAGYETVLAVEWDKAACESLRQNITKNVAQCAIQEITSFPKADVVAGGPPCQGFSNLGERVPNDPRNQLWRQFARAVIDSECRAFVLENVPPLLKSQEYVEFRSMMEAAGFNVEGRVLNAADYGAPQTRKRAIVIGVKGIAPSFPEPTHVDPKARDLLSSKRLPWVTVRDAIEDLPRVPDGKSWHIGRNPTPMSMERYRSIPPGGNRWDLPLELMPECWKRKVSGGTDLFGRLWWDRPSVTIRTEFYKPEKGRYLHPEEHRPITHREAARLQGFPDNFTFSGSKIEVGVQIGNAVPPPLAFALAGHLKKLLKAQSRVAVG